jgi:Tol biopolymer transport system component
MEEKMLHKILGKIVILFVFLNLGGCTIQGATIGGATPSPVDEYEMLRYWLLQDKGHLTAKWGEEDCNLWGSLGGSCPNCGDCKHTGVDYGTNGVNEKVYSVASGSIVSVNEDIGQICTYNEPQDVTFCYLHLSTFTKTNGKVIQGGLIGKTGMRGADAIHLHFEARAGKRAFAACCYSDTINPIEAAIRARGEANTLTPPAETVVPTAIATSIPVNRIAFISNRDGDNGIYVMNADGSGVTNLTNNSLSNGRPVWSPDGSRIAFDSYSGYNAIYVMNADGSGMKILTNILEDARHPIWSPDGSHIAFDSYQEVDDEGNIYVMNADGSNVTCLTNAQTYAQGPVWSPDSSHIAFVAKEGFFLMNADGSDMNLIDKYGKNPVWSPDGSRIAFIIYSYNVPNAYIYIVNADGTGMTNLTDANDIDKPVWSPDGSRLAFESDRDGNFEIYVVNVDGTGVINLTNNPGLDKNPVWSPDGSRIAFISDRDSNRNDKIYIMNADGSGVTTPNIRDYADSNPVWSPDGSLIAFESEFELRANHEIFVMNADGSGVINLTNNPYWDGAPAWSPVP